MSDDVDKTTGDPKPGDNPATPGPFEGFLGNDGKFREDWADNLPENLKETATTVSKFSNIGDVFGELHRLSSSQGGVKVPGEGASEEEVNAFLEAIDAPADAAGYGLDKAPEGFEGEWNADSAAKLAEILKGANVSREGAKQIATFLAERDKATATAAEEAHNQAISDQAKALRELWGDDAAANLKKAASIGDKLGVDLDGLSKVAPEMATPIAELLNKLHAWTSEDTDMRAAIGIPDSVFSMVAPNPMSQAQDIIRNPQNKYYQRYRDGDAEVRKMVVDLMKRGSQAA